MMENAQWQIISNILVTTIANTIWTQTSIHEETSPTKESLQQQVYELKSTQQTLEMKNEALKNSLKECQTKKQLLEINLAKRHPVSNAAGSNIKSVMKRRKVAKIEDVNVL